MPRISLFRFAHPTFRTKKFAKKIPKLVHLRDAPHSAPALGYCSYVCWAGECSSCVPLPREERMVRSAPSRVAWVGRTASMVFGPALGMALVLPTRMIPPG